MLFKQFIWIEKGSMASGSATASRVASSTVKRSGLLRLALVGILCLIGIGYISPAYNFYTRTNEIRDAREVNGALQVTNDDLNDEKQRLLDGAYIEVVARRDLGLVKPGEQSFIVKDIEQEQVIEPAAAVEAEAAVPPTTEQDVFSAVFPF
jgi:cell division protein FtsB